MVFENALAMRISLLPMTHAEYRGESACAYPGRVFYSGQTTENFLPAAQRWQLLHRIFHRVAFLSSAPAKASWAFLALNLFGDESTAQSDGTGSALFGHGEGKSARAIKGSAMIWR